MTAAVGATNLGTILIQTGPASAFFQESYFAVAVGADFVNAGNFEITPLPGGSTGDSQLILDGNFENAGTFTVAAGVMVVANYHPGTFTQDVGATLTVSGSSYWDEGTLQIDGGSVSGSIFVAGASLLMASTITQPTTVVVTANSTLLGDESPFATIRVEGFTAFGTTLTAAVGASNLGTILLQATAGNGNFGSDFGIPEGVNFINYGTFEVNPADGGSSGTSRLNFHNSGDFENAGTFTVAAGADLQPAGASMTSFTQDVGATLAAPGSFEWTSGTLQIDGGSVSGSIVASNCSLLMAGTITQPVSVVATSNVTLLGNNSPQASITYEGAMWGADLYLAPGSANLGTILLQPTGNFAISNLVFQGGTFVNSGTITVAPQPKIHLQAPGGTTGSLENKGTFTIAQGATVEAGGTNLNFIQDVGGTLAAPGDFQFNANLLQFNGGSVSGLVEAIGCSLQLTSTIDRPMTVDVQGIATTLVGNVPALATVSLEFGSHLNLAAGAINGGTIVTQSPPGQAGPFGEDLVVAGGSTFVNDGTLLFVSSSSTSVIQGSLKNQGVLDVVGTGLQITGQTGYNLVNLPGGVINASGTIDVSYSSAGFINNGTLTVGPGVATLTINGAYVQSSTGSLDLALGGTTPGTLYDQVIVNRQATLAGALNVSTINGYTPSNGDSFQVMKYQSATGAFLAYAGTALPNGLDLGPSQSKTALTLTAMPAPPADLAVAVAAQLPQVTLGNGIVYIVTVTNDGPSNALAATLTDTLPSGVTVNSITPSIGSDTVAGNIVTADFGSLNVGAFDTLTIVVTPASTGSYTDSASVSGPLSSDSNPTNNMASAASTVLPPPSADLQVALSPPATVTANGQISFVVVVSNAGPDAASSVNLTDTLTLPQGATIVSATASQGSATPSGSSVTANFGTIATGTGVSLTVIVTTTASGSYAENVSVSSTTSDPFPNNNSTSLPSTPVQPQASLSLTLSPSPAVVNHPVTITATVSVPAGFTAVPTGTVTFYFGSTVLGTGQPNASGKVTLVDPFFPPGSDLISAQYTGDPNYASPTSAATASVTVNTPATTTTTLTVSPSPSVYGQSVSLKATVTKDNGTGIVTFLDGTTVLGMAPLTASGASFSLSTLATGSHSLSARYGGSTDGTLLVSQSGTTPFQVGPDLTSATLTASTTAPTPTQAVTLTAQGQRPRSGVGHPRWDGHLLRRFDLARIDEARWHRTRHPGRPGIRPGDSFDLGQLRREHQRRGRSFRLDHDQRQQPRRAGPLRRAVLPPVQPRRRRRGEIRRLHLGLSALRRVRPVRGTKPLPLLQRGLLPGHQPRRRRRSQGRRLHLRVLPLRRARPV